MSKLTKIIVISILTAVLFVGFADAGVMGKAGKWLSGEVLSLLVSGIMVLLGSIFGVMFKRATRTFKEVGEFMTALGIQASGLDRVNAAAYDALGLMSFYTIGKDEARAWTIRKGNLAPAAGGKIHSDIERGFIRVEVIKYDDLVAAGSEKAAKEQGKVLLKGKDYVIEDGDVCHFLFNV